MHLVVMALMRSCISCHFREIPMFAEHKFDIFGDNLRMPMQFTSFMSGSRFACRCSSQCTDVVSSRHAY